MKYDFDTVIDRKNTSSMKYDGWESFNMDQDALPLWVADMDFKAPEEVIQRLKELCDFGIFGYTMMSDECFHAIRNWFNKYFNWQVERRWLVQTPGVVLAIATAIQAYTNEGDGVVIQEPVYYPFANMVNNNNRILINNQLIYENGTYRMDYDDLEEKLRDEKTKLIILCSPHNPVGRVWTREELMKVAELCLKHNVKIVCDEIHCDFTYGDHKHTPIGSLSDEIRDNCVICTAPSKTFNLAGLQVSNIFISNREMRHEYKKVLNKSGLFNVNMMGMAACQAAYEKGGQWLEELKGYIQGNIEYLNRRIAEKMSDIKVIETQGTYLVWLDLSKLNLSEVDQKDFIVNQAKLWLDTGKMFGESGIPFERINVACPRRVLEEALDRLEHAYNNLKYK